MTEQELQEEIEKAIGEQPYWASAHTNINTYVLWLERKAYYLQSRLIEAINQQYKPTATAKIKQLKRQLKSEWARAERWKIEAINYRHEIDEEFDGFTDVDNEKIYIERIDKGEE